jgi:hypothetical protein
MADPVTYDPGIWPNQYDFDISKITGSVTVAASTGTAYGAMGSTTPYYGNVTITTPNTVGTAGQYMYSTGSSSTWTTGVNTTIQSGLHVTTDAVFDGDIKWKGRSLGKLLESIENRLAILTPDPAKLEKYEALKKAYDNYKLLEKLIGEE